MDLTLKFRLANFLMKNYKVFDIVVMDIRTNRIQPEAKDKLAGVLRTYGPDNLLKHPETLVNGMCRHLGDKDTWNILLGIFSMHKPSYAALVHIDIATYGLAKLKKYLYAHYLVKLEMRKVILASLWDLSESELERVKVLLSWEIFMDHGHIPFERLRDLSPGQLTEQVFSTYSDHTAYVMSLIFNQIQRLDLVEELTAAAYRDPMQTRENTQIGPTRVFKMVHYLTRGKDFFDEVVENIRVNETLPPDNTKRIALMVEEYGADTLMKHPETLVNGMNCYLGNDVTWNILAGILHRRWIDFSITDLHAHGLERLEKYDRCDNSKIKELILDALLDLKESEAELDRVKLLLSWEIVRDYGRIAIGLSEHSSPRQLTEQIITEYSDHTAYVLSLIFTQIRRPDLVERLTAATRVQCDTKAFPDEAQQGNAPR